MPKLRHHSATLDEVSLRDVASLTDGDIISAKETGSDRLNPRNIKVVFEGRPGKAFVSIIDYLDLYESRQNETETKLSHETILAEIAGRLENDEDPRKVAKLARDHLAG